MAHTDTVNSLNETLTHSLTQLSILGTARSALPQGTVQFLRHIRTQAIMPRLDPPAELSTSSTRETRR